MINVVLHWTFILPCITTQQLNLSLEPFLGKTEFEYFKVHKNIRHKNNSSNNSHKKFHQMNNIQLYIYNCNSNNIINTLLYSFFM